MTDKEKPDKREMLSDGLTLTGCGLVCIGAWMIAPVCGVIVAGLLCIAIGKQIGGGDE